MSEESVWLEPNLEAIISRYVLHSRRASDSDRSTGIGQLTRFIEKQQGILDELLATPPSEPSVKPDSRVRPRKIHIYRQVNIWIAEKSRELREFQIRHLRNLVTVCRGIADHVKETPNTTVALRTLSQEWRAATVKSEVYDKMHHDRTRLSVFARCLCSSSAEHDLVRTIQSEMISAVGRYDSTFCYSPPSQFDDLLEGFIEKDPLLRDMVLPAAVIIAEGTPGALMSTLGEFNIALLSRLGITAGAPRAVVYTSLVRYVFGIAYAISPGSLLGTMQENSEFLVACELFAKQRVRDLKMSDVITRHYTPGLPIGSLFNQKQVRLLRAMELMTNPIDLMNHVNEILTTLAGHFAGSEGFLSFDDTLTLLLALLSTSPPGNAIPITTFVAKWERVQLSKAVAFAKDYFVAAVDQIRKFAGDHIQPQIPTLISPPPG
jgi:hypothetical protein